MEIYRIQNKIHTTNHTINIISRVPTHPRKSGNFFLKFPGPEKSGKWVWSLKVLEIKVLLVLEFNYGLHILYSFIT